MSLLTMVLLAAVLATVVALVSGISSMIADRQAGPLDGKHMMAWRVAFQALAFLLILLAMYLAN